MASESCGVFGEHVEHNEADGLGCDGSWALSAVFCVGFGTSTNW